MLEKYDLVNHGITPVIKLKLYLRIVAMSGFLTWFCGILFCHL